MGTKQNAMCAGVANGNESSKADYAAFAVQTTQPNLTQTMAPTRNSDTQIQDRQRAQPVRRLEEDEESTFAADETPGSHEPWQVSAFMRGGWCAGGGLEDAEEGGEIQLFGGG